jgi:hypothetical protein
VREIIVRLCKRPECTPLDPQTIRIIVAALANVDSRYITVELLGAVDSDRCCFRYKITVSMEVSDNTDVDATTRAVSDAISGNSSEGWSVETETSAASTFAASCIAVAAVAAALV